MVVQCAWLTYYRRVMPFGQAKRFLATAAAGEAAGSLSASAYHSSGSKGDSHGQKALFHGTILTLSFYTDSPYVDLFNYHLHRIRQSGLVRRIINKYEAQKPKRVGCTDTSYKAIDWPNIVSAFVIMAAGTVLSIIVFYLEKTFAWSFSNPQHKTTWKRFRALN